MSEEIRMTESRLSGMIIKLIDDYEKELEQRIECSEKRIAELEMENQELRKRIERCELPLDEISDPALKARLGKLEAAPPDTIMREAGVSLEDRLRKGGEIGADLHGVALVDAVGRPDGGTLKFSNHYA